MLQSRGDMTSPRHALTLLFAINLMALNRAGPVGPVPNMTSTDLEVNGGSCALGDVVYMAGDEFPGSTPCEKCSCSGGSVQCSQQVCEPRPGCKALHRPDHCCPTYQCECEQEGRVYSNGEKLVDPADPCRVCYCQGGEVVCRRIACFVRDDCTPRHVPGRCCPEYDNCPLRGVTNLPSASSPTPGMSRVETIEAPPSPSKENIKEFTIKEITPVSEIPAITDVKIKEILPSPGIEVAEYSPPKSPPIPREVTTEKNVKEADAKTENPSIVEINLSSSASSLEATHFPVSGSKDADATPSKISFTAEDSIHSSIYPLNVPIVATMGGVPVTAEPLPVATTKASLIYEEDSFDHNPAFPPLPDDLAVLRNHEDEIVPEPIVDNEHISNHDITIDSSLSLGEIKEPEIVITSTAKDFPDSTHSTTTTNLPRTTVEVTTLQSTVTTGTVASNIKENPIINLRSAIPTELLNSPSLIPEDQEDTATTTEEKSFAIITTTQTPLKIEQVVMQQSKSPIKDMRTSAETKTSSQESKMTSNSTTSVPEIAEVYSKETLTEKELTKVEEQTTSEIAKSNIATEVTLQTELSSLPVETSDQNPPKVSEQMTSDKVDVSTNDPLTTTTSSSKVTSENAEVITVSRATTDGNLGFENVETTEFILESFGSSESATDTVELIKISAEPEKSAAIIDADNGRKTNALTDLINLVSDVASISDHTNEKTIDSVQPTTTSASISDSEELIPVNAGYKSKNKNFNQNSITEVPTKNKIPSTVNKQKIVEIEDDESEIVTDSLPPNDKVEPTTRRPIIDNVSDDNISNNKTSKKDIEIITQSYVPTINRKPTKVVLQKDEKLKSEETTAVFASAETTTDINTSHETPLTTSTELSASVGKSAVIEQSSSTEIKTANAEIERSVGPSMSSEPDVTTEQVEVPQ